MKENNRVSKRFDTYSLEMIVVLILITLHDLLLSDFVSLPSVLRQSMLAQARVLVNVTSSVEYLVPVVLFIIMLALWLTQRNAWERRVAVIYLVWITLRLAIKIGLIIYIITSHPPASAGVLLKDTIVLWIVNFVLFGAWYWIIDAGGPRLRHDGIVRRYDFAFPQRLISLIGWENWHPGFWDYVFLGFSSNTQFGMGDTQALSLRAKVLLMIQITLSMIIIVFMASFAVTLLR